MRNYELENLFDVLDAAVFFERFQVLRRTDERHLAEMAGAFVPKACDLLARTDAAADRRLFGGGVEGRRGDFFGSFEREQTHI